MNVQYQPAYGVCPTGRERDLMVKVFCAEATASVSELKRNPMAPVAIGKRNQNEVYEAADQRKID